MRNIINKCPEDERWPSTEFRTTMQAFFDNAVNASFTLMRAMAKPLGVEEDFFVKTHGGENISLRILYYPSSAQTTHNPEQMGAGAHTDYGVLTLLFQEAVGGLQVLSDDQWLDVPPLENTTVINSGDLLERWTNGAYRSTLHRVNIAQPHQDRLSVAMFLDPDSDTPVAPLASCTQGQKPRYSATTAGQHILEKLQATHKQRFDQ